MPGVTMEKSAYKDGDNDDDCEEWYYRELKG